MPQYRVTASPHHSDAPVKTIVIFPAKNDEEARIKFFENYAYNPNYKWDSLKLIRIDYNII